MNTPTNDETLFLTSKERDRFATYLEKDAATNEEIALQIEKLGINPVMAKRYRTEAMAANIIAQKLRSTEDQGI